MGYTNLMTKASPEHGEEIRRQLGSRRQASGLMCPECRGGRTKERSVSAWHMGTTITAKCWRNACPFRGTWDATTGMGLGYAPPPGATRRPGFEVDTLPLSDSLASYLRGRYRLQEATLRHFGLRMYPGERGVYLPARGLSGVFRGWVLRWTDGTIPKVRSYPDVAYAGAWLGWFPTTARGLVVCVEDVFSALRLWEVGVTAVSLLGVSLSDLKAAEIRRHAVGPVVVALDSDASARAINAARLHNFTYRRLLDADIKDMTEEQLDRWKTTLTSSLQVSPIAKPTQS